MDVKQIIASTLHVSEDRVVPDARLAEDLKADSLDLAELVIAVEQEYGFTIADSEARKIKTVRDVIAYVAAAKAESR